MTDTRDRNLQTQQRIGDLLTARDVDGLSEVFAADVVDHDPAPDAPAGVLGIQAFWRDFFIAFPDAEIEPIVVSADDDHVTAVFDIEATHTGDFQGHPATGRRFRARGIQVARFADGRIVERWGATDELGLMTQLGLLGGSQSTPT